MTTKIAKEIAAEQLHGLHKWHGGDKSRDNHPLEAWLAFAADHMKRAAVSTPMDARQHLIKAAGLLVSAVEQHDRQRSV